MLTSGGEDVRHRSWLLDLGDGVLPYDPELHPYATQLPPYLCMPDATKVEEFVAWVYPDIRARAAACLQGEDVEAHDNWFRERSILTPLNALANKLNEQILELLDPAADVVAASVGTVADPQGEDSVNSPTEFLNTLTPSGLPPHELRLRVGAVVIILRN